MVTHDGARYLPVQCRSIFQQTIRPDVLLVVDDASTDGTRELLREIRRSAPIPMEIVEVDRSAAPDVPSRVASNVGAGLQRLAAYDVVILADQDDEWLSDRVARQHELLRSVPGALLVAGNGLLVDESGLAAGGTLYDAFPPPPDWETLDDAARMRAALRRPFVTGAASAFAGELSRRLVPFPRGWLHDRWATLVAAAVGGLVLQREPVMRYRLHAAQAIGVRMASTGYGGARWRQVLARGSSPARAVRRANDVVSRLQPIASDPRIRAELTWRAVISSAFDAV